MNLKQLSKHFLFIFPLLAKIKLLLVNFDTNLDTNQIFIQISSDSNNKKQTLTTVRKTVFWYSRKWKGDKQREQKWKKLRKDKSSLTPPNKLNPNIFHVSFCTVIL